MRSSTTSVFHSASHACFFCLLLVFPMFFIGHAFSMQLASAGPERWSPWGAAGASAGRCRGALVSQRAIRPVTRSLSQALSRIWRTRVLLRFFGGAAIALVDWYQLPAVSPLRCMYSFGGSGEAPSYTTDLSTCSCSRVFFAWSV